MHTQYTAATSLLRKAGIGPQLVEGAPCTDEQLNRSGIERYIPVQYFTFWDSAHQEFYRPVDYASPPGETPENVLNPLSIYALTRQNIDERDSVDSRNSLYSTRVADTIQSSAFPTNPFRPESQRSFPAEPQQQFPSSASQAHCNTASDEFMPNMALMWEQHDLGANMDSFWPGFIPNFDGLWLPAETAQENMSAMGMPTWVPGFPGEIFEWGFAVCGDLIRAAASQKRAFLWRINHWHSVRCWHTNAASQVFEHELEWYKSIFDND